MLKVEFDAKTGLYKRRVKSCKANDMLTDMTMLVVAFDDDIRECCGEVAARFYRKALRGFLEELDKKEERGQVLQ